MQIYLARNNQQAGPYTLEQVNAMLANTQVVLTDLAWHEGMSTWLPLGQLTGGKLVYFPSNKPTTPTVPVGQNQPASTVRYSESAINLNKVLVAESAPLASAGQRIGASLIDFLLLYMTTQIAFTMSMSAETVTALHTKSMALLQAMANGSKDTTTQLQQFIGMFPAATIQAGLITALIVTVLQIILIATRGQTIGKMALKIKIVDEVSGEKTTFMRSVLLRSIVVKYIGYAIPYIGTPLFLGDFFLLFTQQHRTLHDRLAKTIVVKVPAIPYQQPKV